MLHLIYNKILSDFTEKCEKKKRKKVKVIKHGT